MNEYNTQGKDIRFIDSHYKDLFRLPDGGSIRITFSDGESAVRKCSYIDEYHTLIGNNVFHICQFAELMNVTVLLINLSRSQLSGSFHRNQKALLARKVAGRKKLHDKGGYAYVTGKN